MANVDRVPPAFKLVFLSTLAVSFILLGVSIFLSIRYPHPNPNINTTISTVSTIYKLGFGAVFGLIGGKAAA